MHSKHLKTTKLENDSERKIKSSDCRQEEKITFEQLILKNPRLYLTIEITDKKELNLK